MSELCGRLHSLLRGLPILGFPLPRDRLPSDGLYVVFELGETGHGTDRIVRVGTHRGPGRLLARTEEHFVRENKDRSIFRKNIGRALLARDGDPFLQQWELDLTTRKAKEQHAGAIDVEKQRSVEQRVTEYIQRSFSFVVLEVPARDDRLRWESRIISTVSWCRTCGSSGGWLGRHSPKPKIRESGLWNVNELHKQSLAEDEFIELTEMVEAGRRFGGS